MKSAITFDGTVSRHPLENHLGLLCVVIAPAVFWSMAVFFVCYASALASSAAIATTFFVVTTVFLSFVTSSLGVKI